METRQSVRGIPVYFICLLMALTGFFSACSQGTPVFRSSSAQLLFVETGSGVFVERLSYFVLFDDPDGAYDFGSIRIVHDETGLEWTIRDTDAQVRLRGADRWTGSASLAGPGDTALPGGSYSVTVSDLAGHEAPGTFNLVRPVFPERSPAVFSVKGDAWELVRNVSAPDFRHSFLFLSDDKGTLLHSYRVPDGDNIRVTGSVSSLLSLAKGAVSVRCYTENEQGSAGVLLIPVNIR